ncbi:PEPxxWA-CTERM sorting domain-containing protein [Polymorphobacter fuscus]|uniref:PEPxxWA-CTERM sorting domain-containing protein n=1 Tax=Sandarakinorhabdus fusca TaxID=1439888 RepID=UPI0016B4887B|nr:PEPxxWA-CTERM sorting domain-containing protein [Polymorphobacter fuscus]NJC07814.1 hypothetical protein [Polymorphobacter fuscus]
MGGIKTLTAALGCALAVTATPAAAALLPQSWNGYHWARTGPLQIAIGSNISSTWVPYLATAANAWSAADNIDFLVTTGASNPSTCNPKFGGVQICSANYGANGWLGYTNIWLSGGFVVQATVKLNDFYFATTRYNTAAWRDYTVCQELGHTLGLDHTNAVRTNANTGSCMDYTNDAAGTAGGANGTLANTRPNAVDFAALNAIYANLDRTQLPSTRIRLGIGMTVDGGDMQTFAMVPEPGSWAMLIAGFGLVGAIQRRQRAVLA